MKFAELEPSYEKWVDELPEHMHDIAKRFPPNELWKLPRGNDERIWQRGFLVSLSEDLTCRMHFPAALNPFQFDGDREVFGINTEDLQPADFTDEEMPMIEPVYE